MLKRLKIQNLLLIQETEIFFDKGFTVITGETGSGKTIFLQALKLACGKRAENHLVREGAAKAVIEAEFEEVAQVAQLLDLAGIDGLDSSSLLLKREIAKEGKSRAFINCQLVTLSLLEQIADHLIDFTDQHAHHTLKTPSSQRDLLDRFGRLQETLSEATSSIHSLKESSNALSRLKEQKESEGRMQQAIIEQIEEITAAKLYDGEEEHIETEHKKLSHLYDLTEKGSTLGKIVDSLHGSANKASHLMQQMESFDPSLTNLKQEMSEICLHLYEISRTLISYTAKLEADPKRFTYLEDRLKIIDTLKRKYQNPLQHLKNLQDRQNLFLKFDEEIESQEQTTKQCFEKAKALVSSRFEKRTEAAATLSKEVSSYLKKLNIPYAEFFIELEHEFEEDTIGFFLKANPGVPKTALKDHVSGGELSRVMIALELSLGKRFPKPILIFDEIDANIGGQTASGIGEAFLKLGENRQVIAITHFAQVAKLADNHIQIEKHTSGKQTTTLLKTLADSEKVKELSRMQGKK